MTNKSEENKEIHELMNALKPILKQYLPTLSVRRSQLIRKDHYGKTIDDDWINEIDYFSLNFIFGGNTHQFELAKNGRQIGSLYDRVFRILEYTATTYVNPLSLIWSELEPIDFEHQCAKSLMLVGWNTKTTSGSGDQGIDIIAVSNQSKLVIQCKRYRDQVGNKAVQEIIAGREFEKAQFAAVISTGEFTKSAHQLAASANVLLLHPSLISSLLSATNFDPNAQLNEQRPEITDMDSWLDSIPEALAEFEIKNRGESENDNQPEDDTDLDGADEDLYEEAIQALKSTRIASASIIQRRLKIGYNRAARILNLMEERGAVGPENGSSPRKILVDLDNL